MTLSSDDSLWEMLKKTVSPLHKTVKADAAAEVKGDFVLRRRFLMRPKALDETPFLLDLHGYTVEEAYRRFLSFFEAHLARGSRFLTVITGRGLLNKGAIRREFSIWLETPLFRPYVVKVEEMNGGGAFRLYLKGQKK